MKLTQDSFCTLKNLAKTFLTKFTTLSAHTSTFYDNIIMFLLTIIKKC